MFEQPTPRQLAFIAAIEKVVEEQFTGSSKQEASRWISEHKDEFEDFKYFYEPKILNWEERKWQMQ